MRDPARPSSRPSTEEPDRFSMRVGGQADALRAEALDMLDSTRGHHASRVQASSRRRLARAMSRIREQLGVDAAL